MPQLKLIVGNKNYSSWSLRPWIAMRHTGIPFEEEVVRLDFDGEGPTNKHLKAYSPAGRVPVLYDGEDCIWESLAILEYVSELFPDKHLWPQDRLTRARARTAANEMHAGFTALRSELPMNVRRVPGKVDYSELTQRDINRIEEMWISCRDAHASGGPFLFGAFSIADAMYAPVCSRFAVYDIRLDKTAQDYVDTVLSLPSFIEWKTAGRAETWVIEGEER